MGLFLGTIAAIAAAAVTVTKALAVVGLAVQGIKTIGNALMGLAKAVGLVKSKNVNELGDKALQMEEEKGLTINNFESYEEYIKAVEAYDAKPEKSKMIPEDKKLQKGMELVVGTTLERFKDFPIVEFFGYMEKNPEYFTEERMQKFGVRIKENGSYIGDFVNYVNGEEKNDAAILKTMDMLEGIEKTVNPDISDDEVLNIVANLKLKE